MIIKKITVKNFGTHDNTSVEINENILAVIGKNGSGKTFLIESVVATLYGYWASIGNLYDGITIGYLGDAILSIEIEMDSKYYIFERKVKKTQKTINQEAFVYMLDENDNPKILAGGKVSDYDLFIRNMFGDDKIFMSSVFSSQTNYGDIVDCKPTDRKKILSELLCIDKYQPISAQYSEKATAAKNSLDRLLIEKKVNLDSKKESTGVKGEIVAEIEKLKEQNVLLISVIEEKKGLYQEAKQKTAESLANCNKRDLLISKIKEIENEMVEIEKSKQELVETANKKNELELHQQRYSETSRKYSEYAEIEKEFIARENHNGNIKNKAKLLVKEYDINTKVIHDEWEAKKQNLLRDVSVLSTGDYSSEICKTCNFVKKAFESELLLAEMTENILGKKTLELTLKLENELKELEKERLPEFILPEKIELVQDKSDELLNALSAEQKIITQNEKFNLWRGALITTMAELETIPPIDMAATSYDIEQTIQALKSNIDDNYSTIMALTTHLSSLDLIAEHNEMIDSHLVVLERKIDIETRKQSVYAYLAKAFGRAGIQALLIDLAIPRIQTICDELVALATDGKMNVYFSTIKELKSGGQSESLEIICADDKGERDISQYSGGEKKIIKACIRLTFAIFQALESKIKLESIFIDEAFDTLDAENIEKFMKVLVYLSNKDIFKRIMFISHSDEFLSSFENKLEVKKVNGKSVVC